MNRIQIYTTSTVEGHPIEEYYGLVSANQVAGTGFFSDLAASFSDFFGGNSGAYRSQMNGLLDEVSDAISQKAFLKGANAIVGARIDFDNISAKNMSMFMVSIQGTAVKLKNVEKSKPLASQSTITAEQLECEIRKKKYARMLESNDVLNEDQWKYILEHDMPELANSIIRNYSVVKRNDYISDKYRKFIDIYLSKIPYDIAVEAAYQPGYCFSEIISESNLFNAEKILELAQNKETFSQALYLLGVQKQSYGPNDIQPMRELADFFINLPDVGKIEEVKGGIFSSAGLRYICSCGTKNNPEEEYCSSCGKNIKGLTSLEMKLINNYVEEVKILEDIFSKTLVKN